MLGVMILGFQRAAFSNEAGIGSAAIAHAAVKTSEPVTEGYVGLLEPFIDTVVICTLTALVILITAGMGGGTGTGAAHVIARAAKELNILTVGVVTLPFLYEGPSRMRRAQQGLEELRKHVDTM